MIGKFFYFSYNMKTYQKLIILFFVFIFAIIGIIIKNENEVTVPIDTSERDILSFSSIDISLLSSDTIKFIITEKGRVNPNDIKGLFGKQFGLYYDPKVIIVQNVTEVDVSGLLIYINNTTGKTEITERFTNKSFDNISEYITDNQYIRVANVSFKFTGSKNSLTFLRVSVNTFHNSCYGVPNIRDIPPQSCEIGAIEPFHGGYKLIRIDDLFITLRVL